MKSFYRERRHVCGKTIASAKYQEVDIYPMTGTDASKDYDKEAAAHRRLPTRKAQANLNDRNARRHLVQLVITNFDERDLHVTLTYGPGQEPTTEAEARRDRDNFVRRLAAAKKKAGGAPLKYIIVTEHKDADPAAGIKGIRYHHHVILSCGLDRDKIESLWARKGERLGRCNADRLQFEHGSIEALARYLLKDAKRSRRWKQSRGLAQPKSPRPADCKYTRRGVEKIARDSAMLHDPDFWARKYPGWILNEAEARYTDALGWYIYLKMHREGPPHGTKRKGH